MSPDLDHRCPTCKKPVVKGARDFPFCSDRCRWVDLGNWLTGGYRIPTGAGDLAGESPAETPAPRRGAQDPGDRDGGERGPAR